ncbi:hypothetical protein JR590_003027 [Listeria monocytogenes]|uniref:hypothetical protein n=1 Tax=Listeria TaxID=1637 RepID=UPI000854309C|nr:MULTISPECIES: hypothetical protein [Listeria]EAV9865598.1 hypothetical protein [Listeria monocytogenes]EHD1589231.1 hypothetical protein [Listeria monocytogenes]EHZ6144584.1 hypothetical protein [Listeria monocytogenes]MCD2238081.1 hypothetical protein [Listeria cossartiae]OER27319.1 hypothetical protein AF963_03795 [Listeria monocytogenes]
MYHNFGHASTVDYLLGNSDINYLDITKNELQNLSDEEVSELSDALKNNFLSIFEIGKEKFNMTDEETKVMKIIVAKKFLEDIEENK